jgi:hypothetical protein
MRTDVLAIKFNVTRAQAEALIKFLQRGDIAAQTLNPDGEEALSRLRVALRDIIEPDWHKRVHDSE